MRVNIWTFGSHISFATMIMHFANAQNIIYKESW